MTARVKVGTILIGHQSARMTEVIALDTEPYFGNWNVVKALDGFALDAKIQAARWTFFFLADEMKAMFFGAIGEKKVREALQRIVGKMKQNFNCLQVSSIVAKRFLGIPYAIVSAHARHIQQSSRLDSPGSRANGEHSSK